MKQHGDVQASPVPAEGPTRSLFDVDLETYEREQDIGYAREVAEYRSGRLAGQPAYSAPVAAEGLEANIRKRADHEARLWVRDWTDAHRDAGARETEEWALADRLMFIQEQAVAFSRRSCRSGGLDVERFASLMQAYRFATSDDVCAAYDAVRAFVTHTREQAAASPVYAAEPEVVIDTQQPARGLRELYENPEWRARYDAELEKARRELVVPVAVEGLDVETLARETVTEAMLEATDDVQTVEWARILVRHVAAALLAVAEARR